MTTSVDRREACWQLLELELDEGERVLAEGRAHYCRSGYGEGSTYDYLLVTDSRILWCDWHPRPRGPWELPFDVVTSYVEKHATTHRYNLLLRHRPVVRTEWATAHRFLWWRWGNATKPQTFTATGFMFSRRDTKAALAIRAQLEARQITGEVIGPTPREIKDHERSVREGRAVTTVSWSQLPWRERRRWKRMSKEMRKHGFDVPDL